MGLFKSVKKLAVPAIAGTAVGLATGNPLAGVLTGASLYNADEARRAQESANLTNIQSAREMMEFQKNMSNTSYQRSMSDMYAAGLNPMLAFSQGGASTPSGSQATVQPASAGRGAAIGKGLTEGIASAAQLQTVKNQTAQTSSNIGLQTSQAASAASAAKLNEVNALESQARTQKTLQDAKQSAETFEDRKSLIETERKMKEVDKDWQEKEKWMENIQRGSSALGNLISPFKGMLNSLQQGNSGKNPPPKSNTKHYYDSGGEYKGSTETLYKLD